jgi:MYXO-CTERM domain-containing protein
VETNPIPEPDIRFLVTAVGLGAAVAFRRRRSDLPRFR